MPDHKSHEFACPFYDKASLRCEVLDRDPNTVSSERLTKFCLSSENNYEHCHLYIFRDTQNESLNLGKLPAEELTDLKNLSKERLVDIVLVVKSSVISSCLYCKKRPEKLDGRNVGLCHNHHLKLQKTIFLLQAIHGFALQDRFEYGKFPRGPLSRELTEYIIPRNENLDRYYNIKSDENYHLTPQGKNTLIRLINKYFDLDTNELGLLATYYYIISEKETNDQQSVSKQSLAEGFLQEYNRGEYEEIFDKIQRKFPDYNPESNGSPSFALDIKALKPPLVKTFRKLHENYVPVDVLGAGSSGIVIKLKDIKISKLSPKERFYALKFPMPKNGNFDISNLNIIAGERKLLSQLSHPNIVKIITCDEEETDSGKIPWYIMEYIEPQKTSDRFREIKLMDLEELVKGKTKSSQTFNKEFAIDGYCKLLADIASAISYLHEHNIVHCDVKPANILVSLEEEKPKALLIDLGYAHSKEGSDDEDVRVKYDGNYAHGYLLKSRTSGSQPGANTSLIKRKFLSPDFDLVSFGRTLLELVSSIEESSIININAKNEKLKFKLNYLKLIGGRSFYREIAENSLVHQETLSMDLTKKLGQFKSALDKYQLSYDSSLIMRQDFEKFLGITTLSDLVPEFDNSQGTSLDLGAKGERIVVTTRLKEIIENPDFTRLSLISQLGVVSYVFPRAVHTRYEHCLGTYANTIEYIRSLWYDSRNPLFRSTMGKKEIISAILSALLHDIGYYPMAHDLEEISFWPESIRHEKYSVKLITETLSGLIEDKWDVSSSDVTKILNGESDQFQDILLHSIISGPIDADKIDYLVRDGEHLGIVYPSGIDKQWLISNLTVCWNDDDNTPSICVYEKGRAAAESVAYVRYEMHSVAYWHHTVRIIKAMLDYAVSRIIQNTDLSTEHFNWFHTLPFDSNVQSNIKVKVTTNISYTDYLQLAWLRDRLDDIGKEMIDRIFLRKLYKRLIALDSGRNDSSAIYDQIKDLREKPEKIRKLEKLLQDKLAEETSHNIEQRDFKVPVILIDIPKRKDSKSGPRLYYLPELYSDELGSYPMSRSSKVWQYLYEDFSNSIGKIRILCLPEYRDSLPNITRNTIIKAINSSIQLLKNT